MRRLLPLVLLSLISCVLPAEEGEGRPDHGYEPGTSTPSPSPTDRRRSGILVTDVVDGDTIRVLRRSREVRVRLIGIDAPEEAHFGDPRECFARASTAFLRDRLDGERVRLELDVERRDPFGRLLTYVWHRSRMINELLVARGFASVATYPPNVRYVDRLLAAQRRARAARAGLWDACR